MYILFILALIVLVFLSYMTFNRELLCPPVILTAVFLICACFGLIRYNDWNIADYSAKSVGLILLGIGSFTFFSYVAYYSSNHINHFPNGGTMCSEVKRIEISNCILLAMIVAGLLADILFFQFMKGVTAEMRGTESSFHSLVGTYSEYKSSSDAIYVRGMARAFSEISSLDAVICLYIFLYNFIFRHFRKKDCLLLTVVVLWIVFCLLNSNRNKIMELFAEAFYLIYFFWNIHYGWNRSINRRIVKWGISAFVILISLFLVLATVVKLRSTWGGASHVINYLTEYVGGGIRSFDLFVQDYTRSTLPGKETFFAIHRFLYNRFGIGESYALSLEFRSINGLLIGNIYTGLRRYYADFGITGVIVLPGIMGFFFSKLFKRIKYQCKTGNTGFSLLLFSYLCPALFFFPIEEQFFRNYISAIEIVKIVLIYFIYKIIIEKRCRIRIDGLQVYE